MANVTDRIQSLARKWTDNLNRTVMARDEIDEGYNIKLLDD